MRVCFITSEVFVSRRGCFSKLVRVVSRKLARKGFNAYAITWAKAGVIVKVINLKRNRRWRWYA
jgi:hypothetical protein